MYNADGTTWLPKTGPEHHLINVDYVVDIVNFSPTEQILGEEGSFEESNWFRHHRVGYTGNEGSEDESIYSRYILTFCRREVVDSYRAELAKLVKGGEEVTWILEQEEAYKRSNAAEDAIGMAKYKEGEVWG